LAVKPHVLFLALVIAACPSVSQAEDETPSNHSAVGPGLGVNLPADGREECQGLTSLYFNHDNSFENGYAWSYGGVTPPYYGAFAEGFDLLGVLGCVQLQLTTLPGYYADQTLDIYVWGSDGGNPSNVLSVTAGIHLGTPPAVWPNISTYDIEVTTTTLPQESFIGFWGDWPGATPGWYIAADLNGWGGTPRTNVAPGVGYPTGWNDPSSIWGRTASLGIGARLLLGGSGACCYPDGTCRQVSWGGVCGGAFLWEQGCSDCQPPVTGACCGSDGTCAITTRFDCESGDWRVGAACEPNPCPAVQLGACCVEGVCALTEEGDCPGGSWLGPGTFCQPNPCPEHPTETADCAEYESYAHWIGGTATDGFGRDVAISNGYACMTVGSVFRVVDISDPRNPLVLSSLSLAANGVTASGTHVYVTTGRDPAGTLDVVDITDPEAPVVVGSAPLPDVGGCVAVQGDFAYVITSDYQADLVIVDIRAPQSPAMVGSVRVVDAACVAVSGGYAYVTQGESGLAVIDVSNPQAPRIAGTVSTPSRAVGVAVSGAHVYVGDSGSGLVVVDVTVPESPQVVGSAATPGSAGDVSVSDTCAYVCYGPAGGLAMIDVSDPRFPRLIGQVGLTDIESMGAKGVALAGTIACVGTGLTGLQLIDVTNPRTASVLGEVDISGSGLAIAGAHAYVADYGDGLQVVDIGDPTDPRVVGSAAGPGSCQDVDAAGSHAFVSGSYHYPRMDGYLLAVDVADPAHPQAEDVVDLPAGTAGVAVSGAHAIVVGNGSSPYLRVVDISDPQNLRIAGALALPDQPRDVAVSGDYAYVADSRSGLLAVDISVPSSPTIVGSARVQSFSASGVGVSGGTACVALDGGIQVVDITQPRNLRSVGFTYINWEPRRVSVQGAHAAIADECTGVQIVDLTDPWSPRLVGGVAGDRGATDVVAANGYLFAMSDGFRVLRPPCEPIPDDGDNASADEAAGAPASVRTLQNPALRHATIRLELAAGGFVHATIHDLTGRRVRDLFAGNLPATAHDLLWDGCDDGGQEVATGVYLARIATAAGTTTRRLVMLK
jgi:hypothetical protein